MVCCSCSCGGVGVRVEGTRNGGIAYGVTDNSLSWVHRTKRGQMSGVKVLSELTCFLSRTLDISHAAVKAVRQMEMRTPLSLTRPGPIPDLRH